MQTCKTRHATGHFQRCSNCPDADDQQYMKCTHCSRSAATICTVSTLELLDHKPNAHKGIKYSLESLLTNRAAGPKEVYSCLTQDMTSSCFNVHCLLPEGASSAVDTTLLHWLHKMHLNRKSGDGLSLLISTDSNSGWLKGRQNPQKSSDNLKEKKNNHSKLATIIPNDRIKHKWNIWSLENRIRIAQK